MLDLTGIDVVERLEFRHLVIQSARSIENTLVLTQSYSLLLRVNWPGQVLWGAADGLICLDADGWVQGANQIARQVVSSSWHPLKQPNPGCIAATCSPCRSRCCLMRRGVKALAPRCPWKCRFGRVSRCTPLRCFQRIAASELPSFAVVPPVRSGRCGM